MNQNKLSFESENLVVDWISFNIQGTADFDLVNRIAKYLFQHFDFNSIITKKVNGKWKSQGLNNNPRNQFQVSFRQHEYEPESKSFWVGTKIDFSGKNAAQIYKIIQAQNFDWDIFQPYVLSLSRFDLCYFRQTKLTDQRDNLELFMTKCCQKTFDRSKRNFAQYTRNSQGLILRIGSRKSPNYFRVYETLNGLRFELEMKKAIFQDFLFFDHLKNFEDKLTRHFYAHSKKILILDDSYTDWLIDYSRKTDKPINSLVTSYLTSNNLNEKFVFRLLQFLSFSRRYSISKKNLFSQKYYVIKFPVKDFMDFIKIENKNHYQLKKIIDFLNHLQNNLPSVSVFSDNYFRSAASIPFVEIRKEHKSLVAKLLIAEQLYWYQYPFSFPPSFISYQTNYELQVKFRIIQCMSTNRLEKVFCVIDFLEQFNLSTQKQAHIKKLIVESFHQLQKHNRIQNKFKLTTKKGLIQEINKISPLQVGQSKIIVFYEKI